MQTAIVEDVQLDPRSPRVVMREFRELVAQGARLRPAGEGREDPAVFLTPAYAPGYRFDLFQASYWVTGYRWDDNINFVVAYVGLRKEGEAAPKELFPRLFYKDSSLVWRVATHFVHTEDENWIGKGDVRWYAMHDGDYLASAEETANLPFEIQSALNDVSHAQRARRDDHAVHLVLRRGPTDRIRPYADYTGPRRRAEKVFRINGGESITSFAREGDPKSLRFADGFEPDFRRAGQIDVAISSSRLYGGPIRKVRIASRNRLVQYQFVVANEHLWVNPPQALTTEIMSYGVRTVDVLADEELFVPGYEFHYMDDTVEPPELHSQIPTGFVGPASEIDPHRADATPWTEELPVVREFRRRVLPRLPRD